MKHNGCLTGGPCTGAKQDRRGRRLVRALHASANNNKTERSNPEPTQLVTVVKTTIKENPGGRRKDAKSPGTQKITVSPKNGWQEQISGRRSSQKIEVNQA